MKKLSRRGFAAGALGSAVTLAAQTAAQPADLVKAAVDSKRATAESLAKFELKMSVEPAFQFKA
jgi:spermidine/putrescine-binding protein